MSGGITTCVDGTVGLGGFVYPFITPVLWTGGLGTFNDATLINAEYTPDPSEAGTTVILTLSSNDPDQHQQLLFHRFQCLGYH